MAKTKNAGGLSMKHKIGYAFGDMGGCMTFALMGSIVTRYYTNVLQVNTVVLATLLLVWNVWDAVNDPLMGALMDKVFAKKHNKKGKFRPWLLRSAPMVAICAIVFWTVPTFFKGTTMLVVLFFCKILYEGFYTMFIMPQLLAKYGDTSTAFGIGATICAAIGFVFCLLHYFWTEERHVSDAPSENNEPVKISDILNVFRVNRPFLALCIHGICICTMQYVGSTLGTYMYGDVLGNIGMMSLASAISMPLGIVALIITPKIADKVGLERLIRYCLLIASALYFLLFGALMVLPVPAIAYMLVSSIAMGLASVSIYMQWGLVGEAIDYNEMVTGKRTEGSIYGTFNLTRRIGQTVGNSAAVLALGWIGYQAGAATQTAGTLTGIKVLVVLTPALFVLGSWIAFRFVWNITPEVRAKMAAFKTGKQTPSAE